MVTPQLATGQGNSPQSPGMTPPSPLEEPAESFTTIPLRALFYGILFEGIGLLTAILLLRFLRYLART